MMRKCVATFFAISLPCLGSAHDLFDGVPPLVAADVAIVLSRLEAFDNTEFASIIGETEPYDMLREIVAIMGDDSEHVSRALFMFEAIRSGDVDTKGQFAPSADFMLWGDLVSLNDFPAVNEAYDTFDDWFSGIRSKGAE